MTWFLLRLPIRNQRAEIAFFLEKADIDFRFTSWISVFFLFIDTKKTLELLQNSIWSLKRFSFIF